MTQTFGERVRERRKTLGMSLQSLADAVECSKTHVWQMELGVTNNAGLGLSMRLAGVLGTDVYWLTCKPLPEYLVRIPEWEPPGKVVTKRTRTVDKPRKKRTVKK